MEEEYIEDSIYDKIEQELEIQAREKLNSLNKQQISDYAQKEKKPIIIKYTILGLVFLFLYFTGVIFFVIMFVKLSMPEEKFALVSIKKELKPEITAKIQKEETQKQLPYENFNITKMIILQSQGKSTQKMLFDDGNKLFLIQTDKKYTKIYKYSDIINYEVYENGNSKVKGSAGKAFIGGLFFGLGGAIVGSSAGTEIQEKCNQLQLLIRVNDSENPQIKINYVDDYFGLYKGDSTYKSIKENIQQVCSQLEYVLNKKTLEHQSSNSNSETKSKSNLEELKELKEMLNEGLITQAEFEQKKKQIIGL